jgi:exopolysaccharide biosynthesis polyprenyl glycosylphosphotransferase
MSRRQWVFVLLIIDILAINASIIGAFLLRFSGSLPSFNFQAYTSLALFITVAQVCALYVYDLYNIEEIGDSWDVFSTVVKAVSLGLILNVVLTFFSRFLSFPRPVFIIAWFLQILLLSGWRIGSTRIFNIKWPAQRVLIVGSGDPAIEIMHELKRRAEWGYDVIGMVSNNGKAVGSCIEGVDVLGKIDDLVPLIRTNDINRVIVASPNAHREMLEELARSASTNIRVEVIPDLYEIIIGRVDHTLVSDIPLIQLTREPTTSWVNLSKRTMDVLTAAFALLVSSPLLLVVAMAIKTSSHGSIVYKQERIGQWQKPFNIYKFRTMVANAESKTGPVMATKNDDRITPVGRFLRRSRLDEFPQLVNIIRGEMSFVGPRPERPFFVEKYVKEIPGYAERFKVKPGVTGLAQISGGYATNVRNKLKYDLIYIYHQTFALDLQIIFRTIKVLLTGRGAR